MTVCFEKNKSAPFALSRFNLQILIVPINLFISGCPRLFPSRVQSSSRKQVRLQQAARGLCVSLNSSGQYVVEKGVAKVLF
jgi:hypothetical protein